MKKLLAFALLQGLILFILTGLICLFVRGDFFFRFLAPLVGLAAAVFRLLTSLVVKSLAPSVYEEKSDEK